VNGCIDALPILAVIGCYAKGETRLYNGAIARFKESDRIHCIATELKKMGANIAEEPDGLMICHSPLHGAQVSSHCDHRIALSLTVAALGAHEPTLIEGANWVTKSYPTFLQDMQHAGAEIELDLVRI
jgi:3-phosphoshikimate 1-carboxyvinyltransferase